MKVFAIIILLFIGCSTMPEPEKNHAELQKTKQEKVESKQKIDPADILLGIAGGIIYSPF